MTKPHDSKSTKKKFQLQTSFSTSSCFRTHNFNMSETQQDEGFSHPLTKWKTTYPHDHPLDILKPPTQTKAEIQQAAREKKEAKLRKKAVLRFSTFVSLTIYFSFSFPFHPCLFHPCASPFTYILHSLYLRLCTSLHHHVQP